MAAAQAPKAEELSRPNVKKTGNGGIAPVFAHQENNVGASSLAMGVVSQQRS
jgi:hypothetical protein